MSEKLIDIIDNLIRIIINQEQKIAEQERILAGLKLINRNSRGGKNESQ